MGKYFGTDGIRGEVDNSIVTTKFFEKLGKAVGLLIKDYKHSRFVIIGQDTRRSCKLLKRFLVRGLTNAGIDVLDLGVVPTPIVAFMTVKYNATFGFVITASHNKFTDNGIKIFSSKGFKLDDSLEKQIENNIDSRLCLYKTGNHRLGNYKELAGLSSNEYINNIYKRLGALVKYKGKVVIDCANGAGAHHFEELLNKFNIDYISIASNPDGSNINVNCGATCVENISKAVLKYKADFGIALDGDGDRIIIVDENGEKIDGDGIVNILSKYNDICGGTDGIAGTQMTNMGYEDYYKKNNIKFIRSKVGDRYVLEDLMRHGYKIGGESSGHIINLNFSTTGDGLLTAIQLLAVFSQHDHFVSYHFKLQDNLMKQVLINIPLEGIISSKNLEKFSIDVKEVENRLANKGRVLLRLSGTEPLLRVMVEASDKKIANLEAEYLVKKIKEKLA